MRAPNRASSCMHEAVLEDRLGNVRALRARHQRHQLRLKVGREARKRRGRHGDGAEAAPLRDTRMPSLFGVTVTPCQHVERRLRQFRARAGKLHIAAGHRHRHRIGAGLDPVRQYRVARAEVSARLR